MFDIKWLVSVFYIHVKYIPKIYAAKTHSSG